MNTHEFLVDGPSFWATLELDIPFNCAMPVESAWAGWRQPAFHTDGPGRLGVRLQPDRIVHRQRVVDGDRMLGERPVGIGAPLALRD